MKYFDGAMGTMLNLRAGETPETLNLTEPERVRAVHVAYAQAGADIITTNTFGANPLKHTNYEELISAGIAMARSTGKEVALDIGPLGKLLRPWGDMEFEDCVEVFAKMIRAGKDQTDLILIETMSDLYEVKAAIIAAKENSQLPVFVSMTVDESGRLLTGADIKTICAFMENMGVGAVGLNCGMGPKQMVPLAQKMLGSTTLPVFINPNAGLPQCGSSHYDCTAEEFAKEMRILMESGVSYVGGCCGTTPEFIVEMRKLGNEGPRKVDTKATTRTTSYNKTQVIDDECVVVGERLNPTGKKRLKQALMDGDMDYLIKEAVEQVNAGAQVLDVNVGVPGLDEPELLPRVIQQLQAVVNTPLQIDTANNVALEKALRVYNGSPIINSVCGKEQSLREVLPLAKKYGACVVCLCLDDDGIPETSEGRLSIAKKILKAAEDYGIGRERLLFDALTMTISTNPDNARITLDTVRGLSAMGLKTILGVSNVSFGMPNREEINAAFLSMAVKEGLSAAIINPKTLSPKSASSELSDLNDLKSINGLDHKTDANVSSPTTLTQCIIDGLQKEGLEMAEELLKTHEPMSVINEHVIPSLNEVGQLFEEKKIFLPQLLMAADAASAVADLVNARNEKKTDEEKKTKKTVVLATVEGDIHDIGKNIVKVLLKNFGFEVIDLGKNVRGSVIVETVNKYQADFAGLSALMTTTLPYMEEDIKLLHEQTNAKVIVGGAVLSRDYAKAIGSDFYAKDAMECVRAISDK